MVHLSHLSKIDRTPAMALSLEPSAIPSNFDPIEP